MGESGDDQSGLIKLPLGNGTELRMSTADVHKSHAAYGPYALQGFAEGENLDPRILAVFPAELNTHIIDKGLKDQSLWYLNLKPAVAADVIRSCNLGAHAV